MKRNKIKDEIKDFSETEIFETSLLGNSNIGGNDGDNDSDTIKQINAYAQQLFKANGYKEIGVRTELDKKEIMAIATLKMLNKELKFNHIDNWINDLMMLRYSLKRKSRKEFGETTRNFFQSLNPFNNEQQQTEKNINRNI